MAVYRASVVHDAQEVSSAIHFQVASQAMVVGVAADQLHNHDGAGHRGNQVLGNPLKEGSHRSAWREVGHEGQVGIVRDGSDDVRRAEQTRRALFDHRSQLCDRTGQDE